MKYIDSHIHLGDCRVFGCQVSEKQLMDTLKANGMNGAIVQPYPGASDEADVHRRIYELSKQYPQRIYGLASVNPHCDKHTYQDKMHKYVKEYGFKAIKLHTIGHAVHPMSADAQTVFETAAELKVPINIHTGPGVPFSLPSLLLSSAKKFKDVKIVLAHSGAGLFAGEAMLLAQECPNVYCEMSWCSVEDAASMIHSVGSDRVMFGSDSIMNIVSGLAVFQALSLTEDQQNDVFWRTATTVFNLD